MTPPELVEVEFNVVRAAIRAGKHPATIDRALRNGEIRFRWQDGRRLIKARDLDAWAAAHVRHGTPTSPEAVAS